MTRLRSVHWLALGLSLGASSPASADSRELMFFGKTYTFDIPDRYKMTGRDNSHGSESISFNSKDGWISIGFSEWVDAWEGWGQCGKGEVVVKSAFSNATICRRPNRYWIRLAEHRKAMKNCGDGCVIFVMHGSNSLEKDTLSGLSASIARLP